MKIERDNPFTIKEAISKVPGFNYLRQEGDSFRLGQSGEKVYLSLSRQKLRLVFFIILIFFILILGRAFWLQVIQGGHYNLIAEGNRIRLQTIKAERGIIYDRFNNPLVANQPDFSLYFIPADLAQSDINKENLAFKLSNIINQDSSELAQLLHTADPDSYQPILISQDLSHTQAISLAIIEDELPGIQLVVQPRRQYLEDHSLSHVLGYIGKINQQELEDYSDSNYQLNDSLGKDGIELYYENILRGIDGRQEIEVDATGKTKKILNKIEPQIGSSLILTIDLDLQKKLTDSLLKAIKLSKTKAGGVKEYVQGFR